MNRKKDSITSGDITYEWLGQSTVRMTSKDGFVIYTDPVLIDEDPPKADLILITHHHVDHCLPEFVEQIRDDGTRIAAFHDSYVKYCAQDIKGVRTVKIGQTLELEGIKITGVDAYTRRGFHIRGEGCGFLIEFRGELIYFSGDTAKTEEMAGLGRVDTAIMPICDNAYAIDTAEMIEAVRLLSPRLFIPVHFTPVEEPDPVPVEGMFSTKDPRYFTRKEDPEKVCAALADTNTVVALLRKLAPPVKE